MQGRLTRLTVYSASHFLGDFGCALLLFRTVSASGDPTVLFILYNYCAFALQMPVGLLADKLNRNALMAAAGCALVALGCAFSAVFIKCRSYGRSRSVCVVCKSFYDNCNSAYSVALKAQFFICFTGKFSGSLLDCSCDVIIRH